MPLAPSLRSFDQCADGLNERKPWPAYREEGNFARGKKIFRTISSRKNMDLDLKWGETPNCWQEDERIFFAEGERKTFFTFCNRCFQDIMRQNF